MPLICEIWDDQRNGWKEINQLIPGDPTAAMSNHTVIGGREMYILGCEPDDSFSTIFQSMRGSDTDIAPGLRQTETAPGALRTVKLLKDDESHEMSIMTDRMIAPVRMRFRHVTIDFGTRHCLICEQEIPAQEFGPHTLADHSPREMADWPGGMAEFLAHLRRSLSESIKRAKGFPRVQQGLKTSLKLVNSQEKRLKADRN